jgi:SWIM zinc finger
VPREGARTKAVRLLAGGAVSILEVTQHRCTASVKGDTATHAVTFDGNRWSCDCATVGPCSHALAVARVVAVHAEFVHKVVISGEGA